MSKYKCEKHKSNDGVVDKNGKFHCSYCFKEDKFLNPSGVVIKECTKRDYLIRIVDRSSDSRNIVVEVFSTKTRKLIEDTPYRDLSVALRRYTEIIELIQDRRYERRRRRNQSFGEIRLEASSRSISVPYNYIQTDQTEEEEHPPLFEIGDEELEEE